MDAVLVDHADHIGSASAIAQVDLQFEGIHLVYFKDASLEVHKFNRSAFDIAVDLQQTAGGVGIDIPDDAHGMAIEIECALAALIAVVVRGIVTGNARCWSSGDGHILTSGVCVATEVVGDKAYAVGTCCRVGV